MVRPAVRKSVASIGMETKTGEVAPTPPVGHDCRTLGVKQSIATHQCALFP